jgi:hypothetical protein
MQIESAKPGNEGSQVSENFWKNIYREFFEKWPTIVVPPDVLALFSGDKAEAEARMKEHKQAVIITFIHDGKFRLTVHSGNLWVVLQPSAPQASGRRGCL